MASDVDICNMALSHFGQAANISSINPPDDSAEAEHCARFYPIARNELLEEFDWTFARKRGTVAEVTNDREDFAYKYALPADCLIPRRLLPDGYSNDQGEVAVYEREGSFIYSDEALATLVYTRILTDTTKFSTQFVAALSWRVASYIAGPIVKDVTGRVAQGLRNTSDVMAGRAKATDANSERHRASYTNTAAGAR